MIDRPKLTFALFALGVWLTLEFPEAALQLELLALCVVLPAAAVSTFYLWRVYGRNPVGVIWRQLVGAQLTSLPFIVWVGYLTVMRIVEALIDLAVVPRFDVPLLPPNQSAPVTGLLLMLAATPSIRYAWTVRKIGRAAAESDHENR